MYQYVWLHFILETGLQGICRSNQHFIVSCKILENTDLGHKLCQSGLDSIRRRMGSRFRYAGRMRTRCGDPLSTPNRIQRILIGFDLLHFDPICGGAFMGDPRHYWEAFLCLLCHKQYLSPLIIFRSSHFDLFPRKISRCERLSKNIDMI